MNWHVTAFYKFQKLAEFQVHKIEELLQKFADDTDLNGLVILADEGLNGTVSGSKETIESFKNLIHNMPGFEGTIFKDSSAGKKPFKRFKTKRRDEIVTLGRKEFFPSDTKNGHLPPSEWHRVMEEEDVVVIDTRNTYETDIGTFEGALDPRIDMFTEFKEWVQKADIPKDKKVLMYCTGGIRCEKAIYEMQQQGYSNVFQLEGGILKYLEEYPDGKFQGECFVFDHRVAVDNELQPSKRYALCPHCGDPGDVPIGCKRCGKDSIICSKCASEEHLNTCSKDCAYHLNLALKVA